MTEQKRRIIKRFEREAKKKYELMEKAGLKPVCLCDKPNWHLVNFNVDEIKQIINWRDDDESPETWLCKCGYLNLKKDRNCHACKKIK